jgi:hypothetical protein
VVATTRYLAVVPITLGVAMADRPDPDERFSLYPMEGEEVLKKLLGAEEVEETPEDEEPEDS